MYVYIYIYTHSEREVLHSRPYVGHAARPRHSLGEHNPGRIKKKHIFIFMLIYSF